MKIRTLELSLLPRRFAVCQLETGAAIPSWASQGAFFSVTGTKDELSVVCEEGSVPAGVRHRGGWRLFEVHGPFEFSEVGVLASLTAPLAEAGVSLFAVSTFDTDYLLVSSENVESAIAALEKAGHRVSRNQSE